MRMAIDKSGRHDMAFRIQRLLGDLTVKLANPRNLTVFDADVAALQQALEAEIAALQATYTAQLAALQINFTQLGLPSGDTSTSQASMPLLQALL